MALVCGMGGAVWGQILYYYILLYTIYFILLPCLQLSMGLIAVPQPRGLESRLLSTGDDGSEDRAGVEAEDVSFWVAAVGFYMSLHSYHSYLGAKTVETKSTGDTQHFCWYSGTRSLGFPASKTGVRGQDFGNFVAMGLWCCHAFMTTKQLLPSIDGLISAP